MGRKRIEIKWIVDRRSRTATFGKRRQGLQKKARELSVLTGSKVFLRIDAEDGATFRFDSTDDAASDRDTVGVPGQTGHPKKSQSQAPSPLPSITIPGSIGHEKSARTEADITDDHVTQIQSSHGEGSTTPPLVNDKVSDVFDLSLTQPDPGYSLPDGSTDMELVPRTMSLDLFDFLRTPPTSYGCSAVDNPIDMPLVTSKMPLDVFQFSLTPSSVVDSSVLDGSTAMPLLPMAPETCAPDRSLMALASQPCVEPGQLQIFNSSPSYFDYFAENFSQMPLQIV